MPYSTKEELPTPLKRSLPPRAQRTYVEAFNNAWEQYDDPAKRKYEGSREETAHRVAWSAVKQKYAKNYQGKWQRRDHG